MAHPTTSRTTIRLIAGFDLRSGSTSIHVPLPAQRLLAYLALQRRPVPRTVVLGALWGDVEARQAAARLRSVLWRLPAPHGDRLLDVEGGRLALAEDVDVDLRMAQDANRVAELDVATLVCDLLADWDDDWVVIEREQFRQLRLHRLESLCERAEQEGDYELALRAGLAAVSAEPLRESAHRRVISVHLAEHNPSEALRQYHRACAVLRRELGLDPSPATRATVSHLLGLREIVALSA
ncbi:MAG: transcriptional regulator, family [Frankiales bacterium]|nr:transcriptional regulator, family [Frankiales bacterium]